MTTREERIHELIIKACNIATESEREACAKLAEAEFTGAKRNQAERETGMRIAAAIRARGTKP